MLIRRLVIRMAKEKRPIIVRKGAPEYMNTYGDLVTLLLCFFVLMFASSTIDAGKYQEIQASLSGVPMTIFESAGSQGIMDMLGKGIMMMPDVNPAPKTEDETQKDMEKTLNRELAEMTSNFKTYMAEEINNQKVEVKFDPYENQILIRFKDGMMFDVGSAVIKPEVIRFLDEIAEEYLKHPDFELKIEGHTDNSPINTFMYPNNFYLATYRAAAVGDYFVEQKGVDPYKIETSGFGEYRPIASNDTPQGKAENRRVEIKIIGMTPETGL